MVHLSLLSERYAAATKAVRARLKEYFDGAFTADSTRHWGMAHCGTGARSRPSEP